MVVQIPTRKSSLWGFALDRIRMSAKMDAIARVSVCRWCGPLPYYSGHLFKLHLYLRSCEQLLLFQTGVYFNFIILRNFREETRTKELTIGGNSLERHCWNYNSSNQNRVPELIPVLGSQPAGDVSHKPGGRLPLLSARPAVIPATLKRAATNFAAWWTEAQGVWTVCLRLLPDSVAAAIWTRALLRLSPAR